MVDSDLEQFFDRVNHDRLLAAVAKRAADPRMLRLIGAFLKAGVLENGLVTAVDQGTPQGGPLSPLLSNLVLDELDRELERRGYRYSRYADDCNIYVGSERAGQRVMKSVTRFITQRLKLKVNQAKSAVAQPWQRKFLGFSFTSEREPRRRIAPKAIVRFKERIRELTRRTRGISLPKMIAETATYLRGWLGYFGECQMLSVLGGPCSCGYSGDSGRWCGSNGSADGRDSKNFATGREQRSGGANRRRACTVRGESRTPRR